MSRVNSQISQNATSQISKRNVDAMKKKMERQSKGQFLIPSGVFTQFIKN